MHSYMLRTRTCRASHMTACVLHTALVPERGRRRRRHEHNTSPSWGARQSPDAPYLTHSPSLTVVLAADEVVVLQLTLLLVRVGGAADDELSAPTDSDRSMMAAAAAAGAVSARPDRSAHVTKTRTCTPVRSREHANTKPNTAVAERRGGRVAVVVHSGPVCPRSLGQGPVRGGRTLSPLVVYA